jgi:hypothetical protein
VYEDKLTCDEYQKFERTCLTCNIHHPISLNRFNFTGKLTLNNQLKTLEYRNHIGFGNKKIIPYIFCMCIVAPDIAAALKNLNNLWKEWIFGILLFNGDIFCLRSCHLVLQLLGTLTDQQRFYGPRLVT